MLKNLGWLLLVLLSLPLSLSGCHRPDDSEELATDELQVLVAPPLVGRPTDRSAVLSLVNGPIAATAEIHIEGRPPIRVALAERASYNVTVDDLTPNASTPYVLTAVTEDGELWDRQTGRLTTRAAPGTPFSVALFTDPHLPVPELAWLNATDEETLATLMDFSLFRAEVGATFKATMNAIRNTEPDLIVCLGDMFTVSDEEFNPPFASAELAETAYIDFRRHLGQATAEAPFFAVIGNWEGENGWHPGPLRAHARTARNRYLLNPLPTTYPQGGGPAGDYYAWTWGDALFVVLNVMSYTETVHTLEAEDSGTATSWTLGPAQWSWLEGTFAAADEPVRIVLIHHTVGGKGGDDVNSAYGRGGGLAARVGEQERLHELMIRYGVQIFFYGHDHVFTHQVVDGVHYILPGSAGAPWKFSTGETGYEDYDERSGFALMHLRPTLISVEMRDIDGVVFQTIDVPR